MILPILLMRKKQAAGGGGPFALLTCTATHTSSGTSCGNPAKATVNISYEGDPTGVTLKLEQNYNGIEWLDVATGLTVYDFPQTDVSMEKYFLKFAGDVVSTFRVTNEADAGDTVTADGLHLDAHNCHAAV